MMVNAIELNIPAAPHSHLREQRHPLLNHVKTPQYGANAYFINVIEGQRALLDHDKLPNLAEAISGLY
jgi:hypothetical protein